MQGQKVGYLRVSTVDQNSARQLEGLTLDTTFTDYKSGKDRERPELKRALAHVRAGDVFVVHSMDRLARNLVDLKQIVTELTAKGVVVQFIKEQLTFSSDKENPFSTLMLNLLGSFAEFERAMILERQREGIAIAKAAGKYGRPRVLSDVQISEARRRHNTGESYRDLAEEMGCSRQTLYVAVAALLEKEQAAL